MTFYFGLNPRYQQYTWLPEGINVMFSAGGFWDGNGWRRRKFFNSGLRFLDSGGFTMLNRYGDYPWDQWTYLNLVAFLRPNYYASMDYPCEPNISRNLSHMTNAQRIQATVDNARWEYEHRDIVGHGILVPVIQGYTLDEYKSCIDMHSQAETMTDYMAVGSMCRRLSLVQLHELIPGIAEYAAQGGTTKLHWFGLKLSPSLRDLGEFIYSQDSAVSMDAYSQLERNARDGRRYPRGQEEKRDAFMSFFRRVQELSQ